MNTFLKATAFIALFLLNATLSSAQFIQGTRTLGGGIGFETTNDPGFSAHNLEDYRFSAFRLGVAGGFLLQDNIEAGLKFGYSSQNEKGKHLTGSGMDEYEFKTKMVSLGPYVRLYNPITDVVALFGELGFSAGFGGEKVERNRFAPGPAESTIREFQAALRPGVILMVNENLGLEATIGEIGYYSNSRGEKENYYDTKTTNSSFKAGIDLSTLSFGFRLYLRD